MIPHDVKDIVQSRLPAEAKRQIEEHVDDAIDASIDNDNASSVALRCEGYVKDTEKYLSMYNSIVKRKLNEVIGDVENLDQLLSKVKRDCFSSLSDIGVSSQALPTKQFQNTSSFTAFFIIVIHIL